MARGVQDSVLLARAGRGDGIAFSELVVRHQPRALRLACLLVAQRRLAEAMVAEAFARLQPQLRRLPGMAGFDAMLFRLLVHLARRPPDDVRPCEAVRAPGQQLQQLVGRLTLRQRAVLGLRELEHLSYAEIGAALWLPRWLVARLLGQARAAVLAATPAVPTVAPRAAVRRGGEAGQ